MWVSWLWWESLKWNQNMAHGALLPLEVKTSWTLMWIRLVKFHGFSMACRPAFDFRVITADSKYFKHDYVPSKIHYKRAPLKWNYLLRGECNSFVPMLERKHCWLGHGQLKTRSFEFSRSVLGKTHHNHHHQALHFSSCTEHYFSQSRLSTEPKPNWLSKEDVSASIFFNLYFFLFCCAPIHNQLSKLVLQVFRLLNSCFQQHYHYWIVRVSS